MASAGTARRQFALLTFFSLFAFASACLNDRDSLADEAKKNRDILTTLVGGFERNPPLYYEMRIKRIEGDLKANPKLIDEYDDIAVAYDRIGKDDDAIKWIELKKKQLSPLNMKSETSKDQWYRYYANCGTFWVHRWAKSGADTKRISEVKHGQALIAKALEINPGAHFGREKFQQMVIGWLIDTRESIHITDEFYRSPSLGEYVHSHIQGGDYKVKAKEAVTGLSGLIRLGGAWQSPDVYWAIGSLYYYPEQAMAGVAKLRAREILESGGKSMNPEFKSANEEEMRINDHPELDEDERAEFKRLRTVADKWNEDRQAFMLARLKAGPHPDTDLHFWDGAPVMPELKVKQTFGSWMQHDVMKMSTQIWILLFVFVGVPITLFFVIRKAIRGYRAEFPRLKQK